MTTTTRTTRKAPWAVFLTALLAALAMVLGSLMIAAPANAKNDPDKTPPGHSENFTPPGQDDTVIPPGQNPNFTPPGQLPPDVPKKVWICHADVNNGQGNTNLGVEGANGNGTGGEYGIGYNVIEISRAAWLNAHEKLHPNDKGPFTTEAAALAECVPVTPGQLPATVCVAKGGGAYGKVDFTYPDNSTLEASGKDGQGVPYSTYAPNVVDMANCTTVPVSETDRAPRCAATALDGPYKTVVFYGTKGADITTWKSDPGDTPYMAYFVDVTGAKCLTPEDVSAIDAAVAALPQPATVALPAPGTIKVPAKGPTIPATVPAGDGSTAPTTPVAALTFLVLAATALAASTVRLVGAKR